MVLDNGIIIRGEIIRNIKSANTSIKVAMAYFTDKDIVEEIINSSKKGITVELVLADEEVNKPIIELIIKNLSDTLTLYKKTFVGRGVMHHKFCIVDSKTILKGSYNYTRSASVNNDENLEISNDISIISEFERIFSDLMNQSEKMENISTNFIQEVPSFTSNTSDFSIQLQNLISDLIDKFDSKVISSQGYEDSKKNHGDVEQFKNGLDLILNKYKIDLQQDEKTRNLIKLKIETVLRDKIAELADWSEKAKKGVNSYYDFKREEIEIIIKQLRQKILQLEEEKNTSRTKLIAEKGQLEIKSNELSVLNTKIGLMPFTFKSTWYNFIFLAIFTIYLFVFYSSAIYNLVYVSKEAERAILIGGELPRVEFFNSKAIGNLYKSGFLDMIFNFMAVFIPLGLAVSKLYTKNKIVQFIMGWIIAVLIVDFFVAISISITINKVDGLRLGEAKEWSFADAFASIEFWKVFIFGAIPLMIFKLIVELIYDKWCNSQAHLVDKEKSIQVNILRNEIITISQKINDLDFLINTHSSKIEDHQNQVHELDIKLNNCNSEEQIKINQIEKDHDIKVSDVKVVTQDYLGDIESGNISSLKDVISARVSAYKQGFIEYITSLYSQSESQRRIELINKANNEWNQKTFLG